MLQFDLLRKIKRAVDNKDNGNNLRVNNDYQYVLDHSGGSILIEKRVGNRGIIFDNVDSMAPIDVSEAYKEDNENDCYLKILKILADYMRLGKY